MDHDYLKEMLINGFSRFYVDGGGRYWSKKELEGVFKSKNIHEPLDSPFIESILKDIESLGFIKLLYGDDRYLEVFNIDEIQAGKSKT